MMGLVIHDLDPEQWARVSGDYAGWEVVPAKGINRPCVGCFTCWNRTPGTCAIKDGYENMGSLIHRADEVVVISKYTYGGFSGPVKNVFDRCLGYVLPQFEVIGGETHHKKRYDEDKPFTFIFYTPGQGAATGLGAAPETGQVAGGTAPAGAADGPASGPAGGPSQTDVAGGPALTEEEKDSAEKYVQAVCNNFRAHVKRVEFRSAGNFQHAGQRQVRSPHPGLKHAGPRYAGPGRTVILNGSMRNVSGNSAKLARRLAGQLRGRPEIIDLKDYMRDMRVLAGNLDSARRVILCVPLYVDGLPSQVIRLMELLESYQGAATGLYGGGEVASNRKETKQIYVLANMGLYESSQLENLFSAVKQWCGKCGFDYCGGLGISAGELLGTLMEVVPFRMGATKMAAKGMERLADAINRGTAVEDIYAEPYGFPRSLYIWIANTNWDRTAKQNGLRPEDLYRRL